MNRRYATCRPVCNLLEKFDRLRRYKVSGAADNELKEQALLLASQL